MATPTGLLFNDPRAKPTSTAGLAQPGAYYQYYLTQTLTPATVYKDGALTAVANQTPGTGDTTLAGDGRMIPIYMNPNTIYRVQLYSAQGALLEDTDPYVLPALLTATAIGQLLYPQTAAEIAAGVTPTNYTYPPGNVLRYGADPTGVSDSTTAWLAALGQRKQKGERIVFPAGLYKGNFVVTGQYIDILFEHTAYEDTNGIGFIANNTANPVWQIGDGTTLTSSVWMTGGLKMHGLGVAAKGLLINGAANVWIHGLIVRGFTGVGFDYTASTTNPSSYVFIADYRIDCPAGAASAIAFRHLQPANYPTSYATALYLHNGALQGSTTAGSWGAQVNTNCTTYVSNSYWTLGNGTGLNFPDASGLGTIDFKNSFIDTLGTSNDVLVTAAANLPLTSLCKGDVQINGKISLNGVTSAASVSGSGNYVPFRSMLHSCSVVNTLDFQDSGAGVQDQTAVAAQNQKIFRTGTNFFIVNTSGVIIAEGSFLQLLDSGGVNDGKIKFSTSGILVLTGTGAPAVAAPVGSLYLRTDGGAATSLYVKESGTGTTGWVGK